MNKNEVKEKFFNKLKEVEVETQILKKRLSELEKIKEGAKVDYYKNASNFKIGEEAEVISHELIGKATKITKVKILDYRVFEDGVILPVLYKFTKTGKVSKDRYRVQWEFETVKFQNGEILDLRRS